MIINPRREFEWDGPRKPGEIPKEKLEILEENVVSNNDRISILEKTASVLETTVENIKESSFTVYVCDESEYDSFTGVPNIINPSIYTLYLTLVSTDEGNLYNEYLYVGGSWELVGSRSAEEKTRIYGAEWAGGESSAWTRTDGAASFVDPSPAVANGTGSSPFDNIMPWSGMQIVEDAEAGTLVSIPKYWYKWTRDGAKMKLQIANEPTEGFFVSPAHADRGDGVGERDVVYVGRYHCADDYKSKTGVIPVISETRDQFRQGIHALGTGIYQYDFAMYWTIAMLYLVEFADWNSQAKIGYGCGSVSGTVQNEGATDAMQYHTGTNAASRDTYGEVQYRYIEGLWSNVYDWVDGIYFNNTDVYCIKNPADFSDTTGGTLVGTRADAPGFIKAFTDPNASGFEYALYPNSAGGSANATKYVTDFCGFDFSGVVLYVGGRCKDRSQYRGLFFMVGASSASYSGSDIGSRLMKLA